MLGIEKNKILLPHLKMTEYSPQNNSAVDLPAVGPVALTDPAAEVD
jgi:hypothetical protein